MPRHRRAGRAKKAAEVERLKTVELASNYSMLKGMRNDELSDQLKIYKARPSCPHLHHNNLPCGVRVM